MSLFADRGSALAAFDRERPDLAIVDIGLGDEVEGGFDLCRELRARWADLPIVFLTAREAELDVVSGLRLGADDYCTKGIGLDEMLARIAVQLRRVQALRAPEREEHLVNRGELALNRERLSASWRGEVLHLTPVEFSMVLGLASRPGHVKSRQQLMDAAGIVQDDSSITSHIKRIRRKFQGADPDFSSIETVYGMGYRWSGD